MKQIWIICVFAAIVASQSDVVPQLMISGPQAAVPIESSVILRCFVPGTSMSVNADIRWFKTGQVEEIRSTVGRVYIERDDEQSLKLYITNIQQTDAGQYRCEGQVEGNDVQDTITLQLYQDITFENAPTPQHPVIYTDAIVECVVTGQPTPEISWRYRGERIENDHKYDIDTTVGLRITNISEEDNGQYECRAEVPATGRFDKVDIDVIVHTPPTITMEMGEVQGVELQEVSISCQADGNPAPTYNFYRDNNEFPVEDQDDRVFVDHQAGVIDFRPLDRNDQGDYRCEASNQAGTANSLGYLDVIVPPKVYRYDNVTEKEGDTATLTCFSEGEPDPDMSFRKVGNSEDYVEGSNADGRIEVRQIKSGELQMTVNTLTPTDTANYTCKSRNEGGFAEQNGTITVEFAPRFPEQETEFYGWAGKTRNVTCFTLAEPQPEIEWWQYNEQLENNETFRIIPLIKNSVLQIYVREEDSTWIYSEYTCRAKNQHGQDDFALNFNRAMAPDAPADVRVKDDTPTTVILEVDPPLNDGGVPVIGYRVSFDTTISDYGLNEVILIENLRPSTIYSFLVSARNEVGPSDPYNLVHEMPAIQEPYPIVIVSDPEGLYPFEYTLHWEKPRTGGLPIEEYEFQYRKVKVEDGSFNVDEPLESWIIRFKEDDPNAPMMSYTIEGLTSNQHYQAEVRARNDIGWSIPNEEFVFLTAHDPEGRPNPEDSNEIGDRPGPVKQGAAMTTAGVIGIVIAIFFVFLVIVDISCYFLNNCGVTKCICVNVCGEPDQNDQKLVADPEKGGEGTENKGAPIEDARVVQETEAAPPPVKVSAQREEQPPIVMPDEKRPLDEQGGEVIEAPSAPPPPQSPEGEADPELLVRIEDDTPEIQVQPMELPEPLEPQPPPSQPLVDVKDDDEDEEVDEKTPLNTQEEHGKQNGADTTEKADVASSASKSKEATV